MKHLTERMETMKVLEENMNCSIFFFYLKDKGNQSKNEKWDMI